MNQILHISHQYTLGQNEGSRGHTNFMYYVSWTGKYIIFARIKSLRHKKTKVIVAFFYSILRDFQLKDFRLNSLKWCRFASF